MAGKKQIKVYFCPKCRSMEVGFVFGVKNIFGLLPTMQCKKCGFTGRIFPLVVIIKCKDYAEEEKMTPEEIKKQLEENKEELAKRKEEMKENTEAKELVEAEIS